MASDNQSSNQPLVGVIMGSDSDLPVMKACAETLKSFDVPFEISVISAHRTFSPLTSLPVIGVPIKGKSLDGVDSLYSIVQMPRGIPVATVAIDNSTNAGLLAVRMLGAFVPEYYTKMEAFLKKQEEGVLAKVDRLEKTGWENY
ncbi:3531_t:CDS:2 [Paraglomus brasilianum]|uniref:phosphoribosylaminoimidazole carboxylase n=1 Tax=Paraglomus brasilianum TaxID=144538 RepID=A0A9N9BI20_9GLOM|nr:3531_t:CDS:2 [Paraglomus brasilianum]